MFRVSSVHLCSNFVGLSNLVPTLSSWIATLSSFITTAAWTRILKHVGSRALDHGPCIQVPDAWVQDSGFRIQDPGPCIRTAPSLSISMLCECHGAAIAAQSHCHGNAMSMPWQRDGTVTGHTTAMTLQSMARPSLLPDSDHRFENLPGQTEPTLDQPSIVRVPGSNTVML